ncbi:hypothetical protein A6R68_04214 [Neotoma lepida]|uniref:Uncharacterized protein n=1 Tax=Neotoma lepida TaxID=56216 RepID=A0A1A6GPG6_NEOLE|nr:hypothetical protein A6R68_04214 [Neotoma lepida]
MHRNPFLGNYAVAAALGHGPRASQLTEDKLDIGKLRSTPPSMVGRTRPHGVLRPGGVLSGRRDPSCGTSLAFAFSTRSKIKINLHSMSIFIDLIMSLLRGTRCLASLLTLRQPHQRTA